MQTTLFKGTEVQLSGNEVNVGDKAPVAMAVGTDLGDVEIGGAKDKVQFLVLFHL